MRRNRREAELDDEIEAHFALAVQQRLDMGYTREEAEFAARYEFGNVSRVKEVTRTMWAGNGLDSLRRELRLAMRRVLKTPAFTAIAIFVLALGIGPNTAIFSVVYANLIAPLPYPHPKQLVMIWSKKLGVRNQVSAADFLDWQREASSFQGMAAFTSVSYNLSSAQEPQYIPAERASTNLHRLVGETVWMGRDFRSDEDQAGKDHVFILSHKCWATRFGADPNIIGKQFRLNGEPYTAIGVMPPGPSDRHDEEIWVPLRFSRAELQRGANVWNVIGRLKPGVSIPQAQQEMNAIAQRIGEQYPESNQNWGVSVEPLQNDFQDPNVTRNLWLLLGAVSFVLLIACVNMANLLVARGATRQRELAVHAALGASGTQLVLQLLIESLTLAALGGIAGTLLSGALLKIILALLPPGTLSSEADVRLSIPVLLFTLATTVISGVLFGCAPALQAKKVDLNDNLKEGGRSAVSAGRARLRHSLVALEFALALTLLTGAALTVHSFVNRLHIDLGVRTDRILTFYLPVPQSRVSEPQQTENFYRDLLARIEEISGVNRAAAATGTPLEGTYFEMPFSIAGQLAPNPSLRPDAGLEAVTPGYFATFGVHVAQGRTFTDRDSSNAPRVVMVNEAFVRRFLRGVNPVSQRLAIEQLRNGVLAMGPAADWRIVGVYHDVQNADRLGEPVQPEICVPFAQDPWPNSVIAVRTAMDPEKMANAIAAAVHSLDPDLPLVNIRTMKQIARDRFVDDRFGIALYGSLAGIALLLASLGIYGVMSFMVAQRTSEIGLRMALGANHSDVVLQVLKQGFTMAATGLAFGFAGAYWISRAMQTTLYGTGALDWRAFGAVAALLVLAALLACYVPARRASSVDPLIALRQG